MQAYGLNASSHTLESLAVRPLQRSTGDRRLAAFLPTGKHTQPLPECACCAVQVLVVDGVAGLVTGSCLERMGGHGTIVLAHSGAAWLLETMLASSSTATRLQGS